MTSPSERYDRLHRALNRARALRGAERETYLDDACGDDESLRSDVVEMLAVGLGGDAADLFDEAHLSGTRQALEEVLDHGDTSWMPDTIGNYRVLQKIGRGGMGVVYEAEQPSPRRRVAIKLLHPMQSTPDRMRRFHQEAELLGRLQHPGIAQIYEASTFDAGRGPQPYFAMEFVDGLDIRSYCSQVGLGLAERVTLLAAVADAVQYAHNRGVIHRDLKPDNVLVDSDGRPRILDFGIARASDDDSTLASLMTAEGQILGTLSYMAPELFEPSREVMTEQLDVYSLGVLAFEILTGRLPLDTEGMTLPQAFAFLAREPAPRAGSFDARLRGDLELILGKALESDRKARYASAAAFAGDLRRYLCQQPILARRPSRAYMIRKFARRNKALVGGVAATLFMTVAGAVVATKYALDSHRRADALERGAYTSGLVVALAAVDRQDYAAASESLAGLDEDRRGWEYDHVRARLSHRIDEWELPARLLGPPTFDGSGESMVAVLSDGTLRTWDTTSGELTASVALVGTVDLEAHPMLAGAAAHGGSRRYAAITPGGDIVIRGFDGAEQHRIQTGSSGQTAGIYEWDPGGRRLLYNSQGLHVWDGARSSPLGGCAGGIAAFDHGGDRVARTSNVVGEVASIDLDSLERTAAAQLDDQIVSLAFSPDDRWLVATGYYQNVFLLDGETLEVEHRLCGHLGHVTDAAWSRDGTRFVTTSLDGTLRVWDPLNPGRSIALESELEPSLFVEFLPEGRHVLSAGPSLQRFPIEPTGVLHGHGTYVYRLAFSPDGSLLASAGFRERHLHVWDVSTSELVSRFCAPRASPQPLPRGAMILEISEDNRRLVAAHAPFVVDWEIATGDTFSVTRSDALMDTFLEVLGRSEFVRSTGRIQAASSDGRWIVLRETRGALQVFDASGGPPPDAAARRAGLYGYVADRGLVPRGTLEGHLDDVLCVDVSPDGSRIATGSRDTTVRIWETETLETLLVLRGHSQYVHDVRFSPDGSILATASGDTTVRLWDTLPLHERRALGR